MHPVARFNIQLTPLTDRTPVKAYVATPRGTLYWGGAGLDGAYIPLTVKARAGIGSFNVGQSNTATRTILGDGGMFIDALRAGLVIRYEEDDDWVISSGMTQRAPQFNLIGYSYGSLLAAQTANFYAKQGHVVDHLVLIGSPIDASFLSKLRQRRSIRKVVVIDLTRHGDPIHAGISQLDLIAATPQLRKQMSGGRGEGHFYYAHVTPDLLRRLDELAARLVAEGLK